MRRFIFTGLGASAAMLIAVLLWFEWGRQDANAPDTNSSSNLHAGSEHQGNDPAQGKPAGDGADRDISKADDATAAVTVTINVTVTNSLNLPQLTWVCGKATLSRAGYEGVAEFAGGESTGVSGRFNLSEHPWLDQSRDGAWSGTVEVALSWFGEGSSVRVPLDGIEPKRTLTRIEFSALIDTGDLLDDHLHIRGRLMQGDNLVANCVVRITSPKSLLPELSCLTDDLGVFSTVRRHSKGLASPAELAQEATATPWRIELCGTTPIQWYREGRFLDMAPAYSGGFIDVTATPQVDVPRVDLGDVQVPGAMVRVLRPDWPTRAAVLRIGLRSGTTGMAFTYDATATFPACIPVPAARYDFLAMMQTDVEELRPWMAGAFVVHDGDVHDIVFREPDPQYTRIRVVGPDGDLPRADLRLESSVAGYLEALDFENVELPFLACTKGRERIWVSAGADGYEDASAIIATSVEELVLRLDAEQASEPEPAQRRLTVQAKVPEAIGRDLEGYARLVHESGAIEHFVCSMGFETDPRERYLWSSGHLPLDGNWTVTLHGGLNWGYGRILSGPATIEIDPGEHILELPPLAPPPWDSPHYLRLDLRCEGRPFYLGAPCLMADGRITDEIEVDEEEYPVAILDGDTEVPFKIVKQVDEHGDRVANLLLDLPARVRVRVNNAPSRGVIVQAEGVKSWCWAANDESGTEAVFWLPAGPAKVFCDAGSHTQTRQIVVPRTGTLEVVFDVATGGARLVCESEAEGAWELFSVNAPQLTHVGLWRHPDYDAYVPLPAGKYRAVPHIEQSGAVVEFEVNDGQETVVHLSPPTPHETRDVEITLPVAPDHELRWGEFQCIRDDFGARPDAPLLVFGMQSHLDWRRTENGIRVLGLPKGISVALFGFLEQLEPPQTTHWYLHPLSIGPQATSAQATWVKTIPLAEEWYKPDVPVNWKFEGTNAWQLFRECLPKGRLRLRYLPTRRLNEIETCTIEVGNEPEVPLPPELRALIR